MGYDLRERQLQFRYEEAGRVARTASLMSFGWSMATVVTILIPWLVNGYPIKWYVSTPMALISGIATIVVLHLGRRCKKARKELNEHKRRAQQ
jgi:hypothetical protein